MKADNNEILCFSFLDVGGLWEIKLVAQVYGRFSLKFVQKGADSGDFVFLPIELLDCPRHHAIKPN